MKSPFYQDYLRCQGYAPLDGGFECFSTKMSELRSFLMYRYNTYELYNFFRKLCDI